MFRLAHMSDLHLAAADRPRGRQLMNKRLIGYLNWRRSRRAIHQGHILESIVADLIEQAPDHTAVTGDLVNFGLPAEFEAARAWLETLGPPDEVSVIPGNHDAYVAVPYASGIGHWRDYMQGDALGLDFHADPNGFPYVRARGPLALIGLCSAIPTLPFMAAGRIGAAQLHALRTILDRLGERGCFRVVLVHHPPKPRLTGWARALRDARALMRVIQDHGAELVLYGHNHRHEVETVRHRAGQAAIVGVPSASAGSHAGHALARYNLYAVDGGPGAWRCELRGRGLTEPAGKVRDLDRASLTM